MSKISTYPSADTPLQLSDRLIGTEAIRPTPSPTPLATKNFSLGELLQLFSSNFPAASLQAVLNTGNTATQNITLIGTIDTTLIKPDNIEDTSGSQGLTFQFLSKGTSSINWVDLPVSNLQEVLDKGNSATSDINLIGNIVSTLITPSNIRDEKPSIGNTGQVLTKSATGIVWADSPTSLTPGLADVLSVGNIAATQIILNNGIYESIIGFDGGIYNRNIGSNIYVGIGSDVGLGFLYNGFDISLFVSDIPTHNIQFYLPVLKTGVAYTLATTEDIPSIGTWGELNYPIWTTGTPFVKMTAVGTFALDTNTYLTGITSSDVTTALGYIPVTNARTLTINGTTYDLSANRSWTITSSPSPLTTKGDLYTFNSVDTRLPVGLDTQVLIADSSTPTGLKWGTNTAATPTGYYGAFQDATNQTAAVINMGYPMRLGIVDLSNGITVVSNSRVTIANTGIYNIQWSAQFTNPTAAEHDVTIWLRKNGVDVPGSAGVVLVPPKHGSANGHVLPSWNFLLDPIAGDYYEFVWSTVNTSVYISFEPAGNPPPSTASVVLTVTQQSGIMAGTGITAINSLTNAAQTLATNGSGTDFNIVSLGATHTFNLPTASAINRGALSSADWSTFNNKAGANTELNYRRVGYTVYNEFLSSISNGSYALATVAAGTITTATGNVDANHFGVVAFNSSASANSGFYSALNPSAAVHFSCTLVAGLQTDLVFKTPGAISPTTVLRFGVGSGTITSVEYTSGFYFEILYNQLVGKTANAATRSSTAAYTIIPDTWYHLRVKVTSITLITYSVYDMNGSLLFSATLNTNLPTTTIIMNQSVIVTNTAGLSLVLGFFDYMSITFPSMVRGALN